MGAIYRAQQLSTKRMVALKVIRESAMSKPNIVKRFTREMRATAAIDHPNTVEVYDFGQTEDGALFLAMELLEGRTLSQVIKDEGPMDPERAARVATQIALALGAAHREKILHRDLKPSNIMLVDMPGQPDLVKVLDFGIARFLESAREEDLEALTMNGRVMGTPQFMAPEQITQKPLSSASDMYALGVLLYLMVTGRAPFRGKPLEIMQQHVQKAPRPPVMYRSELPVWLNSAILAMMEKDPAKRPVDAEAVVELLKRPKAPDDVPTAVPDRQVNSLQPPVRDHSLGELAGPEDSTVRTQPNPTQETSAITAGKVAMVGVPVLLLVVLLGVGAAAIILWAIVNMA
ncbi:MAG: serine/threonine protein kinase [Deltaproteobacteria bacterium]|nr:MAG: serine/threonine protein kinase [Deltaproteobacteria bacterium]